MAYTTINDPSEYFNTLLYTGTGKAGTLIKGNNFEADWIWTKERTGTSGNQNHTITDTSRGLDKQLFANLTSADGTSSDFVASIESDGFTLNTNANINNINSTYVAWQWRANGATTTTNDSSSTGVGNQDSVFQANTTAGFSIVTWAGQNQVGTIAHGLGVIPNWIIIKARGGTEKWGVYHHKNTAAPETDQLILNASDATADTTTLTNDTAPTSSVFTVGDSGIANENDKTYVGYLFAEKQGYSKFGSYKGNGDAADGPFNYTGFRPAWVMIKETGASGSWHMFDNKRKTFNVSDSILYADLSNAEATGQTGNPIDILSNGFKCRGGGNDTNLDDGTYVYMAFAESPFVTSNGTPNNAR